ncbi:hypothetical protein PMM47T1_04184 [Pseudomonas sp. M47T1]|uniref:Abi family protein n=1 Tax=Pseudomonas sp. M47T1 TaxID=1179778 RepID=UPI0002607825|nr:Abi family protein [Pseudomonas sp. M47T1]EIK97679.1 hypothetical protein PMM47T1_04184 [Pseudomonas sp. M47T1]
MSNAIAESVLESLFSKPRIARYAVNPRGAAASVAYLYNLQLAESIMPCLHILEVALRNAIDRQLKARYGRTDWWSIAPTLTPKEIEVISSAQRNIQMKRHAATPDRIVSELSFGFWVALFNLRHESELWKELRLAFPRCPKNKRKRTEISKALNMARDLRNRVAHHDALLWLQPDMQHGYQVCLEVIGWLDPQLKAWLRTVCRFPVLWGNWMNCPLPRSE